MKLDPYSVDEIDGLLNGARVWATIKDLQKHMEGDREESTGDAAANLKKVKTKLVEVRQAWEALTRDLTKANGEAVENQMVELEEMLEELLEE